MFLAASAAALNYNLEVLATGLIVGGVLETGGSAGLALRGAGLALIAQGDLETGWTFFKLGSAFASRSFLAADEFAAAFGLGQVLGLASVGAIKLARNAPEIGQALLNIRNSAFARLGDLLGRGFQAQQFFNSTKFRLIPNDLSSFRRALLQMEQQFDGAIDYVAGVAKNPDTGRQTFGKFIPPENRVVLFEGADLFTVAEELRHSVRHKEYLRANNINQSQFNNRWNNWTPEEKRDYNNLIEFDAIDWFTGHGFQVDLNAFFG